MRKTNRQPVCPYCEGAKAELLPGGVVYECPCGYVFQAEQVEKWAQPERKPLPRVQLNQPGG